MIPSASLPPHGTGWDLLYNRRESILIAAHGKTKFRLPTCSIAFPPYLLPASLRQEPMNHGLDPANKTVPTDQ